MQTKLFARIFKTFVNGPDFVFEQMKEQHAFFEHG